MQPAPGGSQVTQDDYAVEDECEELDDDTSLVQPVVTPIRVSHAAKVSIRRSAVSGGIQFSEPYAAHVGHSPQRSSP
jgi:hypothetical protein